MILKPVLHLNLIFSKQMTNTWCVGGRHCSNTINQNIYEKANPKTKKVKKNIKGKCDNCGRNQYQIFLIKRLK